MKSTGKYISLSILSFSILLSSAFSESKSLMEKISFVQSGKTIAASETVVLANESFEIHFADTDTEDYIAIFATSDFDYQYEKPTKEKSIDVNSTVMFNPGTYLIKEKFDSQKGAGLTVVDSYGYNGFWNEQRLNQKNEAIIPVTSLSDSSGKFSGTADFYFFVDYNNDQHIDENEFTKIKITIEGDGSLYKNSKAYISTMGYSVHSVLRLPKDEKYHLYVIDSLEGAKKFCSQITAETSFIFDEENFDFETHRLYILHSPVTNSIFLKQPYVVGGTRDLIFETEQRPSKNYYISARNYIVQKEKDIFKINVKIEEGLVKPVLHKMD